MLTLRKYEKNEKQLEMVRKFICKFVGSGLLLGLSDSVNGFSQHGHIREDRKVLQFTDVKLCSHCWSQVVDFLFQTSFNYLEQDGTIRLVTRLFQQD